METIDEILGSMFITYMHAYCQAFKLKSYSVISNLSKLG